MTNALCVTLKNVSKYYFVDKQRKMTSNGWKKFKLYNISFGIPFGRNCSAMPSHAKACNTYSCYRWLRDFTFPRIFPGWKPSVFLKKKRLVRSCRMYHTGAIAAFTVSNICPFKCRTRESEREQVKIYTLRREKLTQNSSIMVIVLRSIHRVEKTHFEHEKPLKCLNTFL